MFFQTEHTTAIADTLKVASEHSEKKENLFTELLHHTQDSQELELPFLGHIHLPHIELFGIDMSITKHVVFLILSAIVLIILGIIAARANSKRKVPTGFGNLIEVLVVFIRDEIAIPNMGKGGTKYVPYLCSTFFFILIMNLFGMIPYGASATGNVNVTAGLAIIAFFTSKKVFKI